MISPRFVPQSGDQSDLDGYVQLHFFSPSLANRQGPIKLNINDIGCRASLKTQSAWKGDECQAIP